MIPFIDLNAQQKLIRDKIDNRINITHFGQKCTDRILIYIATTPPPGES